MEGYDQLFVLKGYAGTGKTTLLKAIADYRNSEKRQCKLMAPTGRAAMIIGEKSKRSASTIHRAIYNFHDFEEVKKGTSFKLRYGLHANEDSADCLYLVDEASMIPNHYSEHEFMLFGSGRLLQDLMSYCLMGDTGRKVILIGDDAQLPPVVGKNQSPALKPEYLSNFTGLNVQSALLSQVVRQDEQSKVLAHATRLRKALQNGAFNTFKITPDGRQVMAVDRSQFIDTYTEKAAQSGLENVVVITHSNGLAKEYNQIIRERRYGAKIDQLHKKDRLLITKNNYNGKVELFNGMFAEVQEVGSIVYRCSPKFYPGGEEKKSVQRNLDFRMVRVKVRDARGDYHEIDTTVIDHFLYSDDPSLHPLDQRALYIDFKSRMTKRNIKPGSPEFRMKLRTDKYFNALQAKFGYAITCHKSQGGEWPFVFVDFNVFMGKAGPSFFRWAYTAITRSSDSLSAVDSPDFNAFSRLVFQEVQVKDDLWKKAFYAEGDKSDPLRFVQTRMDKLNRAFKRENINYTWERGEWFIRCKCQQGDESAKFMLHFKKSGFSRAEFQNVADPKFKSLLRELLRDSLIPDAVPFQANFPAKKELYHNLKSILSRENAVLTNIIQHPFSDKFFFMSDDTFGMIEFYHNKKHEFTRAVPYSTTADDECVSNVITHLKETL